MPWRSDVGKREGVRVWLSVELFLFSCCLVNVFHREKEREREREGRKSKFVRAQYLRSCLQSRICSLGSAV